MTTTEEPETRQQSMGFDITHEYLGEEFLTWIWFQWETSGGEFTLPDKRVVGIAIGDLIQFAPRDADDHQQTIRGGTPTRAAEARTALRRGHMLRKARLTMACGPLSWTFTLDAGRMAFSGVRGPDDSEDCESHESQDDRNNDRATNWLLLHAMIQTLFGQFLVLRTGPRWITGEAAKMAEWMAT